MTQVDLKTVDDQLYKIANMLSRLPYLPNNLSEEKEKFFNSDRYNPTFRYEKEERNLEAIKQVLQSIKVGENSLCSLFKKKQAELSKIIDLMQSVGTRKFTEASKDLYGVPDEELVKKAWRLIGLHDLPEKTYISTGQARVHLEFAMQKYGFDWQVRQKDMASKACVSIKGKTLLIKKNSFFTKKFLNRLIVHEIGTHIMRYQNGLQQHYKIFSLGLTDYLGTEEGLAVVNEELNHCLTKATLKTYAARVIAVHKALKCTFRETYNYILPYVGKNNAFDITLRVKRGLGDTMFAGAFTKDYLYLKGYFEVRKFLQDGGEVKRLYYGKIGLKDLPVIEQIPNLINPLFMSKMKYYTKSDQYRK